MQRNPVVSSLKELAGLSVFLSWTMCAFYSNVVWPQTGMGWVGVAPVAVSMGASGIAGALLLVVMGKSRHADWAWPSWTPWIAGLLCAVGTLLLERSATSSTDGMVPLTLAPLATAAGFALFCLLWGSRVSLMEGARIEVVVPVSLAIAQALAFGLNAANAAAPEVAEFAALPSAFCLLPSLQPLVPRDKAAERRGSKRAPAVHGRTTVQRCRGFPQPHPDNRVPCGGSALVRLPVLVRGGALGLLPAEPGKRDSFRPSLRADRAGVRALPVRSSFLCPIREHHARGYLAATHGLVDAGLHALG